jgi:hypothetical protein
MFSPIAERIYLLGALLALALVATLMGVHMAMSSAGTRVLTATAASFVRMLLFPEIVGAATLWIDRLLLYRLSSVSFEDAFDSKLAILRPRSAFRS